MAGKSATIAVKILGDSKGATKAVDDTTSKLEKFKGGMKKASVVAGGVLAAEGALAKGLVEHGRAARDTNGKISSLTERLGTYGKDHAEVADRIIKNAENMSKNTGIDDQAIKSAQTMLLGFDGLADSAGEAGGMFDRVTNAAVDMEGAGLAPVGKASKDLARSLQEPDKGLRRLERSGVAFTDQQKDQIEAMVESGDKAGAQAAIMENVESKVKGAGEANADAADKQAAKFQMLKDELGKKLLPVYDEFMDKLGKLTKFATENSDALIAVGLAVAGVATAILVAQGAIVAYNAIVKTVQAVTKIWTGVQWLLNAALAANPVVLIVVAIIALVAAIIYAWNNVDGFKEAVVAAWEWIKETTVAVFDAVVEFIGDAIDNIGTFFTETLPAAVQTVLDWLAENWPLVLAIITGPIGLAVKFVVDHWEEIKQTTVDIFNAVLDWIKDTFQKILDWIIEKVADIVANVVTGFQKLKTQATNKVNQFKDSVKDKFTEVVSFVKDLPNKIVNALGNLGSKLYDSGQALIQGFVDGIKGAVSWATDAASDLVSSVRDFFPFSPAKRGPLSGTGYTTTSGARMTEDFADAISGQESQVRRSADRIAAASRLGGEVESIEYDVNTRGRAASSRGRPDGRKIEINFNSVVTDRLGVAREIKKIISDYDRLVVGA